MYLQILHLVTLLVCSQGLSSSFHRLSKTAVKYVQFNCYHEVTVFYITVMNSKSVTYIFKLTVMILLQTLTLGQRGEMDRL